MAYIAPFQSTPSQRGRPLSKGGKIQLSAFQSTPSQRGRPVSPATATLSKGDFNPRPRKEGDIVINGSWRYPSNFNPRPRKEGDKFTISSPR